MSRANHLRTGSAGSRAGSASQENKNLRDVIAKLKDELVYSQAETQKVTNQLNCLITLVKKAWTGDKLSAVHVANIVGVAPPDMHEEITKDLKIQLSAKPKSRALNNWALLAIGLLNKEYSLLEREMKEEQRQYLQFRQDFLEEQLLFHRDDQVREASLHPRRSPVGDEEEDERAFFVTQNQQQFTPVAHEPPRRKPSAKHLYRTPSKDGVEENGIKLKDLFIGPGMNNHGESDDHTVAPPSGGDGRLSSIPREARMPYDDSRRYSQGLSFDAANVVGAEAMKKRRPVSAKKIQQGDTVRARPRSAVVTSTRPLKYETTRPISAQVSNRLKQEKTTNEKKMKKLNVRRDSKENLQDQQPMKVKVRHPSLKMPDSVTNFEEDLRNMNQMQDDFGKTMKMLQDKLGIADKGTVY